METFFVIYLKVVLFIVAMCALNAILVYSGVVEIFRKRCK